MSDRGMMKWAPFSSLIEQSTCLEKMRYERNKIEKPHLSSDKAREINEILIHYHGETLKIKYFYDGYLYEISTKITRIDTQKKLIFTEHGSLPINSIIDISSDDYF